MDLVGGKWGKEILSVKEMTLSLQLKQLKKDGLIFRKV
jgi:DNA-binding HxlR family transcriptional regulator